VYFFQVGFFKRKPKNDEVVEFDDTAFSKNDAYNVMDVEETKLDSP